MNTCRLAAKFVRLFTGVDIVLVPDRDRAGEEGAQFSARVLRGAAKSVRIAVLPAEFKESDGDDVRDILRRTDGQRPALASYRRCPAACGLGAAKTKPKRSQLWRPPKSTCPKATR